MKLKPWMIGAVGLLLLGGAYVAGRCDAPSKSDNVSQSIVDGFQAYAKRFNEMTRQINDANKALAAGSARERSLAARRTPTPTLVPASCAPWATNLTTCDSQVAVLKGTVEDAGRILALTRQARSADSARADSSQKALKRELGKGKIFGMKLPSRRTSFAAGGIIGVATTTTACLMLTGNRR